MEKEESTLLLEEFEVKDIAGGLFRSGFVEGLKLAKTFFPNKIEELKGIEVNLHEKVKEFNAKVKNKEYSNKPYLEAIGFWRRKFNRLKELSQNNDSGKGGKG